MADALNIEGLHHRFGEVTVLGGVDLAVAQGELVALLGASGCGKTTLLRIVAGLLHPTDGSLRIGGVPVVEAGVERVPCEGRRVGLVFQDFALFPTLSVRDNIGFGLSQPDPSRVDRLLGIMGLEELADRRPSQLSGGQQQRVALARALAPKPALILLDEPFANVDAQRRLELGRFLRQALVSEGASALFVTHDQDTALSLGDRVAVLVSGDDGATLVQVGRPEEVYQNPVSEEVARLTGPAWRLDDRIVRPGQARFEPGEGPDEVLAAAFAGRCWSLLVRCAAGEVQVEASARLDPGTVGRVVVDP